MQVEVMENLDQRAAKSGDLEAVLDASNESYGVDLGADVLKETANKH